MEEIRRSGRSRTGRTAPQDWRNALRLLRPTRLSPWNPFHYRYIMNLSLIVHFSVDYYLRIMITACPASLIEGRLRRHPEGGARRGVLRQRLRNRCPGRYGKPPAGHYDPDARSSL